jgi:hypothetical protein
MGIGAPHIIDLGTVLTSMFLPFYLQKKIIKPKEDR